MYNNDNKVSVIFLLKGDGADKVINYEEVDSLYFIADNENNGIEFDVEYAELLNENEYELQILLSFDMLHETFNILKNPLCVIVGVNGSTEMKLEPSQLSVTEIVELGETDDIYYNTITLEAM